MARDDDGGSSKPTRRSKRQQVIGAVAATVTTVVAVGGFYVALSSARGGQTQTSGAAPTVMTTPAPPTSVMLRAAAPGIAPTTQRNLTVSAGTTVTLTVIPDQPLVPFQTLTMGIYAHDPHDFSELQYCTYPNTDTCSYVLSYSSAESTDYTKGTHTFTAFLGNVGGAILQHSNDITITWSQ